MSDWTSAYEDEIGKLLRTYEQEVRERIALELESWDGWDSFGLSGFDLLHDVALIVRGATRGSSPM